VNIPTQAKTGLEWTTRHPHAVSPGYRSACPTEFKLKAHAGKATPNAPCARPGASNPLRKRSTGTKVTGAV